MAIVTRDSIIGDVFTGRPKKISWERLWTFSGGPFKAEGWPVKNIHTSLEFAKACGLPSRVAASASQLQGYIAQLMIDLFGVEWLSHGTMDVKFIRIVNYGDTVITKAILGSKEIKNNTTRFVMDIDCENQRGEKVLVGVATGFIGKIDSIEKVEFNRRLENLRSICTQLSKMESTQLDPLEYVVSPELNQQFLYGEEDFAPRYIRETAKRPPIVHPALILNWSNDTRSPSYKGPSLQSSDSVWATLHTRDETFFYNPAKVGSKLKVTWEIIGSYERRGRLYSASKILVVDGDGQEIIRRLYYTTRVSPKYQVKI